LRRFEYVLVFAEAFAVFWPVVFGVRPRRGLVALVMSAALLLQLQFEGFRWQMIPLYLVAVGLAIGDVFYLERRIEWSRRIVRGLLGAIGLVFASALPFVLPVPEIPAPGGPEPIGTFSVQLTDPERPDPYAAGPRELMVQVWYPSTGLENSTRLPWSDHWEVVAPAIATEMGLPSWFWNHTGFTLSHATDSPRIGAGTFPVVVYSHGWDGVRTNSLNQIEHLVSNGYIVIAPDHTYAAAATVLEDGEIAYQDPDALPDPAEVDEEMYAEAATRLVQTVAGDIVTVLNALERGEEGPFGAVAASADLNRIGVYGHTTGGGGAIKVCLEDERCAAVLAMDPWVAPLTEQDLQLPMTRPALYMRSEGWLGTPDDALLSGIAARGDAVTYSVGIEGATSRDFLMLPLLSPFASQLGWTGTIPPGRIISIVDNYLLGFFDVFLLGTGTAQLDSVSFEEVTVSVFDPQG
jgi:dienelactone hydrolase